MDLANLYSFFTQLLAAQAAPAAGEAAELAEAVQNSPYIALGGGIAIGLAVLGAGWAIGTLGAAALQGSARQPEIQGKLQTMMILAIAFIEALALIGIIFGALLLK